MNANFCSYCGTRAVDADSRFCASCGRPLAVLAGESAAALPSQPVHQSAAPAEAVPNTPKRGIHRLPWYVRVVMFVVGVIIMISGWKIAGGGSGGSGSGTQTSPAVTYPTEVRTNFINACLATGGGVDRCQCSFRAVEAHMALGDFLAAERVYAATGVLPAAVQAAIGDC